MDKKKKLLKLILSLNIYMNINFIYINFLILQHNKIYLYIY